MMRCSEAGRTTISLAATQHGVATLLTCVVLLFCIGLLSLYATHVAVTEQRLAANDIRARQALAAAQAGLDAALGTLPPSALDAAAFDLEHQGGVTGPAARLADGSGFATMFDTSDRMPDRADVLIVRSEGFSADETSRRTLRQTLVFVPWIIRPPSSPLVRPTFGDSTSNEDFFTGIFGGSREAVRTDADSVSCPPCPAAQLGGGGRLVWIDSSQEIVFTGGQIGSHERPLILIVDGDLRVRDETSVTGFIYVAGKLRAIPGRLVVQGALAVEGAIDGAVEVSHQQALLERLRRLGRHAKVAGSWADF